MKKIRHHINNNKKISYTISVLLIFFSLLLIYIDYYKAQQIYKNIKKIDTQEIIFKAEQDYIKSLKNLDYYTDDSVTKFVNNKVSFEQLDYIPKNIESISSDYVYDTKGYSKLRNIANEFLQNLAKEFKEEFGIKLSVVSAYRSYNYQKGIKDRGCPDNLCAKAGYSEHQTGLAIDIFAATTQEDWQTNQNYSKYFEWFKVNAYKYGFHNTYQRGLETDGYEIEPWHWRYLGTDLAKYLWENELTIAEFYREL